MAAKVFVSGATGTTGLCVTEALLRRGASVRAGVHSPRRAKALPAGAERVDVDFSRPETFEQALDGIEAMYLMTPLVANMVELTALQLAAARRAGVRHIVKLSGAGAEVPAAIRLGCWHRQAERLIEESGIAHTFLRPVSFMQNFALIHGHSIKGQNVFYDSCGRGRVSYVDARDVAEIAAVVLTEAGHEGRSYIITGPEPISHPDVAEMLSRGMGREIRYVDVARDSARAAMVGHGVPPELADALCELHAVMRDDHYAYVTRVAETVTGRPARTFDRFLRDYRDAFT